MVSTLGIFFDILILVVWMRIIPHGLGHLESWFSAGDAIWGRLEGVALLQEVCQCVWGGG